MWKQVIYRKCACGETAHDAKYHTEQRIWTWPCRNCGTPANNRSGATKTIREHDRPGSTERGPG